MPPGGRDAFDPLDVSASVCGEQSAADGTQPMIKTSTSLLEDNTTTNSAHAKRTTRCWTLWIVLSVECLFSGGALGSHEHISNIILTTLAITSTIWAESMVICKQMLRAQFPRTQVLALMFVFGLTTPIGAMIGIVLGSIIQPQISQLLQIVLLSVAAGFFIHIAVSAHTGYISLLLFLCIDLFF